MAERHLRLNGGILVVWIHLFWRTLIFWTKQFTVNCFSAQESPLSFLCRRGACPCLPRTLPLCGVSCQDIPHVAELHKQDAIKKRRVGSLDWRGGWCDSFSLATIWMPLCWLFPLITLTSVELCEDWEDGPMYYLIFIYIWYITIFFTIRIIHTHRSARLPARVNNAWQKKEENQSQLFSSTICSE